jgi:hypothetical protein
VCGGEGWNSETDCILGEGTEMFSCMEGSQAVPIRSSHRVTSEGG